MVSFPPRLRRILTATETSSDSCSALQKSLRKLLVVGISMPQSFVDVLTRTFQLKELRSGYGMSEVGGFLTVPPSGEISGMNVGFPVSNTKMMVADPVSGKALGPMERGELLFNSPYIGSSYRADLQTKEDFADAQGWFHTGDLGYYDQDGRLFLCGRLKTNFKSMAKTVIPSEIEQCLLEHEAVKEVAVLGVPTPEFDQAPTAVVVLKNSYSSDQRLAEDLKSYVADRMPVYKHLRGGVYFADALPQNSLGKVRIIALKQLLSTLRGKECAQRCTREQE